VTHDLASFYAAVYPRDDGIFPACLRPSPPEASLYVVQLSLTDEPQAVHRPRSPQRPIIVDGHQALESVYRRLHGTAQQLITIVDRQVEVSIQGPTLAGVKQLVSGIRIIDVDQQGCPTRAALAPVGQLPPQEPTGAVLCSYDRGWSESSRTLDSEQAKLLWREIMQAPAGSSIDKSPRQSRQTSCTLERQRGLLVRLIAADRSSVTLVARLAGCGRLGVRDDRSSRRIDTGLGSSLRTLLRYPGAALFGSPHFEPG
jgi:hypothetical protein